MHIAFWWGNQKGRYCLDELGAEGKMILKCISKEAEREVTGWINVAGSRDKGWIMVNMVMYYLVAYKLLVEELLASRQGLRTTDIELTNFFYLSSKWPFIFTHIHHSVTASAVSVSTAIKYN